MLKEKAKRKMQQKEGQEKLCKNLWALPNGNNWLNNQNLKYNLSVKAKLYKVDFTKEILKLHYEMLHTGTKIYTPQLPCILHSSGRGQ